MAGRTDWVEEVQPRGFRPYREYRDSGVEWLGNIPAHWEVERLKFLATLNDEALPEATDPNLEMNYVDISSVDAISGITGTDTIIFEKAPSRARRVVRRGDVIVSTVRTYLRAIAAIEASESNLIVSTGFAVLRARRLDSSFASYALRAPHFVERVVANSVGVSYPAINASSLACFPIPYPGVDEQRAIADFLDRETAKIDGTYLKIAGGEEGAAHRAASGETHRPHHPRRHPGPRPERPHEGLRRRVAGRDPGTLGDSRPWPRDNLKMRRTVRKRLEIRTLLGIWHSSRTSPEYWLGRVY